VRVILRTPLSHWSGYGRDGIGLTQALLDRGHDVMLAPSAVHPPIPRDVAGLLCDPVTHADVAIHHIEPHLLELKESDWLMARRNVAWTMWGFPKLPHAEWVDKFAEQTQRFDQIAVYDPDSVQAFAPVTNPDKLIMVQGGYAAEDWGLPSHDKLDKTGPFVFGMVGKLTVRKGVYLAFKAFWELKEEHGTDFDAVLELHSTEPVFPGGTELPTGVVEQVGKLLPEQLKEVYWHFDTLLAPSAADAKHLPPIEALSCGCPVILSDIPGHRTWASSQMVTWVKAETPVSFGNGFDGTEVDLEDLKAKMWEHYTDRFAARSKAMLAASTLPAMLDWTKCLERLGGLTDTLL
jgi:glycosyltransferase involved in cell wall biosynthesis